MKRWISRLDLRRLLWTTAILAAASASLMGARIALHHEIWLDRTYWLVAITGVAGLMGTGLAALVLAGLCHGLFLRRPRIMSALAFGLMFVGSMDFAYVVQDYAIGAGVEPYAPRPLIGHLVSVGSAATIFLISSPTYLLPWLLPSLVLIGAGLLPGCIRRPDAHPQAARDAEQSQDDR